MDEPLLFEHSSEGRTAVSLPWEEIDQGDLKDSIPPSMLRETIEDFPEISEIELVRHFTRLSQWNHSIDTGFYPLGSCTMKYNPKVNEEVAKMKGFSFAHPYQPEHMVQGCMKLMYELERFLAHITGMDRITLQPAAGAHGELTGMMMVKAYLMDKGSSRHKVLIPDTAHGTNPASVSMCGFKAVTVRSNKQGVIDPEAVESLMDEEVAAIMITNPNTLGLFEKNIGEVARIVHKKGGLVYCDGANLNALMGIVKIGDLGIDLLHMNLHKTFSTPHGGGGPGAGPLAVKEHLAPYLPIPVIEKNVEKSAEKYVFKNDKPKSIGRMKGFYGNFLVFARAYAYILSLGGKGLKETSQTAVVNANYIRTKLKETYHLPYDVYCMHECVFTDDKQKKSGVTTLDIAKRLMDYGFHPPTIYFPLVVSGALMIEPTETESRQELDRFISVMKSIAEEAQESPQLVKDAPVRAKISRVDEVTAARKPILRWSKK